MGYPKQAETQTQSLITMYDYDNFNRLRSVRNENTNVSYEYLPDGMRKNKTVNGVTTSHIWDGENIVSDITNGNKTKYLRGINLISLQNNNDTYYYRFDGHGDTKALSINDEIISYDYDAFGNQLTNTDTANINPFRYCGEYYDNETGNIYLRNRYYDSETGRFITEDPIRDGYNWYVYCGNNPIMFVDPLGLEYIVISGGRYSKSDEGGYEFIETAITKIREWRKYNNLEEITWMVANAGWSDSDVENFQRVADNNNVNLMMLDSTDDFVEYVNKKNGHDRYKDKIKKVAVFSHGKDTDGGTIELAYYHDNPSKLQISKDTIKSKLWASAFDSPNSWFGACNLATKGNDSFAKAWKEKFGGRTWAFYGKSTYIGINSAFGIMGKPTRKFYGFSFIGSDNYPVAATDIIDGIPSHLLEVK